MNTSNEFEFSGDISFIYDLREKKSKFLVDEYWDKNDIKPKKEDILFLEQIIEANLTKSYEVDEENYIKILQEYQEALSEFTPGVHILNKKTQIIYDIIKNFKKKSIISLKNIYRKYKSVQEII